jgi:F0F1-type ATP synthase membrane subunit b/b'
MFTSGSILKSLGMPCGFLLCVLWLAAYPAQSQPSPQTPERWSGDEEVLRRINPHESDSIWEKGKKVFTDQMNRPYFRFNVASTVTLVWLLLVLFVQRINHRHAEDRMVHAIADALAQDARSREEARQAIKRYNDHIEACNRRIEERERLAAASSDEEDVESTKHRVERINQQLTTTPVDKKEPRQEIQRSAQAIDTSSLLSKSVATRTRSGPPQAVIQGYLDLIAVLEDVVAEERRKNREIEKNRRNEHARDNRHESGS